MSSRGIKPKILVVLGPTASGKSNLAVSLARKFQGEVISADSRQVYKGLDIGTGKITMREMRGIPHHLLDVASPKNAFTAVRFQRLGNRALKDILLRGKLPVVCGGTGFYIDSLIYDYKLPEVKADPALRKRLEKETSEQLFQLLKKRDPKRASVIDRFNKRRLVRALEIVMLTGQPVPARASDSKYDVLKIGMEVSDEDLRKKIRRRFVGWLKKGLIQEIKKLKESRISKKRLKEIGMEYPIVNMFIEGKMSKEEMLEKSVTDIWRYSRRQMTWFKRDKNIHWIKSLREAERLVKKFLS